MAQRTLPMFPLGTVLVPHAPLPLHVFEPRYRTMMRDVLDGDREDLRLRLGADPTTGTDGP